MGYRSQVIIGIPKEKAQQFIDLEMPAPLDPVLEIFEQVKTTEDDVVIFNGDYLKWYDACLRGTGFDASNQEGIGLF